MLERTLTARKSISGKAPLEKSVTVKDLAENMEDLKTLAKEYGRDEVERGNVFLFLRSCVAYALEFRKHRPALQLALASEVEGPTKIIESTAKKLVDAGISDPVSGVRFTLETAREFIIANRKKQGLPV